MTTEALAPAATESGPRRPWATAASDTADTLSGFLAPRVVTTLVAIAIVIGVGSLIV